MASPVRLILGRMANVPVRSANDRYHWWINDFQFFDGSRLKWKSSRRPTENCRANVAPPRPKRNFRDNDSLLSASRIT